MPDTHEARLKFWNIKPTDSRVEQLLEITKDFPLELLKLLYLYMHADRVAKPLQRLNIENYISENRQRQSAIEAFLRLF